MPTKRALIVDDSRTAQFKLKKILEAFDLIIDTVLSAEDALSYLSYQTPHVIFMDHSMKGMSGLDAVKIIKSNTATAMIPVVMYTAQSGEVYLSQARAIGAIDVLSKDVMTDSDIQRVMSALKVSDKNATDAGKNPSMTQAYRASQTKHADLIQIRDQVAKSIDIQQVQLRRELQDNTRLLVNRFMREIRDLRQETERQKQLDREMFAVALDSQKPTLPFGINRLWSCAIGALSICLIWTLLNNGEMRDKSQQLMVSNEVLSSQIEAQQKTLLQNKRQLNKVRGHAVTKQSKKLLHALVWAVNQAGQFEFSETALGDSRIEMVTGLVAQLNEINFRGTLTLDIHNGDFCVVMNESGSLSLPNQPIPITSCDFLSNSAVSFDGASQTSVDFINLLRSYPIVERGDLKIEVQAHGLSKPVARYPDLERSITSDQWNGVALANNRLNISLSN